MKLINKILIAVTALSVLTACGGSTLGKEVTAAVPIPVADPALLANWTALSGYYKLSKVVRDEGKNYLLLTDASPPLPPGMTAPVLRLLGQGLLPASGVKFVAGKIPACNFNMTTNCATSLDGLFSIVIDFTTTLITLDQSINTVGPVNAWSPLFSNLPIAATVATIPTAINFVPQTVAGATEINVSGLTFIANGVAVQAKSYVIPPAGTTLSIPLCSSLAAGDPQFCTTTLSGTFVFKISNSAKDVIAFNIASLP